VPGLRSSQESLFQSGIETIHRQGRGRAEMMKIRLKRVYEKPDPQDGTRILVDRLWPRGLSKAEANVDVWIKGIAPSTELRKWYAHERDKWPEFKERYFRELSRNQEAVQRLLELVAGGPVTLLFSTKEAELNNAVALKEYLGKKLGR
jgi:uncharacterized protein YeaO (DUF488 family)